MENTVEEIRNSLIENENKAIFVLKNKSATSRSVIYKNYFRNLKHAGDLIWFIKLTNSSKAGNQMTEEYHLHGLKTAYDILNGWLPLLSENDCISFDSISVGDEFTIEEISALAKTFYSKGMYYLNGNGARKAIVKATFFGGPYADKWINEPNVMLYHMEKESLSNFESRTYKKECNRAIYNSIFSNSPFPIYVFARGEAKQKFLYCGVFKAANISEDGTCFLLSRIDNQTPIPTRDPRRPIQRPKALKVENEIVIKTEKSQEGIHTYSLHQNNLDYCLEIRNSSNAEEPFELLLNPLKPNYWVALIKNADAFTETSEKLIAGLILAMVVQKKDEKSLDQYLKSCCDTVAQIK